MTDLKLPHSLSLAGKLKATKIKSQRATVTPLQQTYNAGQRIIFNFPSQPSNFINGFLSFTGVVTPSAVVGAGPIDRFPYPITSIFSNVKVWLGSTKIEDVDNVGLLEGNFSNCETADRLTGGSIAGLSWNGSAVPATRTAESLVVQAYRVKLHLDSLTKFYPLDKSPQQFRIELTLGPNTVLESDAVAPTMTMSIANLYWYYDILTLPPDLDAQITSMVNGSGFVIPLRTWSNYQSTQLGAATVAQFEVQAKYASIERFLAIGRLNSEINDPNVYDRTTIYPTTLNGLTSLSLKSEGLIIPVDQNPQLATDASGFGWSLLEDYVDAMNALTGIKKRDYNAIACADWLNRKTIAFDLRIDKDDSAVDEVNFIMNNGLRTNMGSSVLQLRFNLAAAYASTPVFDFFTQFQTILTITSGGSSVDF